MTTPNQLLSQYVTQSQQSSFFIDKLGIYNVKSYGAVGDGITDDTQAIQNTINAAYDNGGGVVVIPRSTGSYIFTRLTNKDNVVLKGYGGVLKLKDNTCTNDAVSYYLLENLNYSNCVYEDLIIDGNQDNNTTFLVADGITVGGENVVVRNCWLYDIPDSGIMFSGATNSSVVDNRIDNCRDLGIYINDGDGTNHYENVVSGNKITDCSIGGGIALKRICQRTIVSHNTIFNCANGITLEQASTTTDFSKNVTITNNRIRNIVTVGISLRASSYSIVANNRIENFSTTGIGVSGDTKFCSIIGNVITSDGTIAVGGTYKSAITLLSRLNVFPSYNTIAGNSVEITNLSADIVHALYLLTLETKISGGEYNIISNNTFKTTAIYAARITSAYQFNTISNNIFNGSSNDLFINASVKNDVINNIFVNNTAANINSSTETYLQRIGNQKITVSDSEPTLGTWEVADKCYDSDPVAPGYVGWVCVTAGTQGTLNSGATTGSITTGTATLTVSSATGLAVGNYITIAGVTGIKKITVISGTTITIDSNANASVTDAAVAYSNATFKSFGIIDLQGTVTWNPADLADGVGETSAAITVTGAALGDFVLVSAPYDLQGITCNGYVSATNTVKIRIQNETGGNINLAEGVWKVKVIKA